LLGDVGTCEDQERAPIRSLQLTGANDDWYSCSVGVGDEEFVSVVATTLYSSPSLQRELIFFSGIEGICGLSNECRARSAKKSLHALVDKENVSGVVRDPNALVEDFEDALHWFEPFWFGDDHERPLGTNAWRCVRFAGSRNRELRRA